MWRIASPYFWSEDRFHPSAHGYRRVADVLLPALLATEEQLDAEGTVQDVVVAAGVASREPGVTVEMVPGEAASTGGAGRLARLVRRIPLAGRGEPEPRREGPGGEALQDDGDTVVANVT